MKTKKWEKGVEGEKILNDKKQQRYQYTCFLKG